MRSLQSMYSLVRIWAESFVVIATASYGGYDHWREGWSLVEQSRNREWSENFTTEG